METWTLVSLASITTIIINLVFLYSNAYHILAVRKTNLYFQGGVPDQRWVFMVTELTRQPPRLPSVGFLRVYMRHFLKLTP